MIRKQNAAASGEGLEFVLSDETVDRYGDVVEAGGWKLENFRNNPIALFGHDSAFPIGKWADLRVENGALRGKLQFAAAGTSARIDEIRSLAEQGILRAVSVGFRPLKAEPMKTGGKRYKEQELLETSLVSIPALPSALSVARGMGISADTLAMVFGENAEKAADSPRGDTAGKQAETPVITRKSPMTTLSQRIEDAQNELVASRDRLTELNKADALDLDAIEELNDRIETQERTVAALKASEAKLASHQAPAEKGSAPAIARRPLGFPQREVSGLDLLVRATVVHAIANFDRKSIDKVLDERYPGHEATAVVAKADQTIGTTGVAGWATELMQTSYASFVDALRGRSIYPDMRASGMALNFDQAGTAYIPSLTAGGANGSFFAEGTPMRVGRVTTAATTMTPRKMGVIVPFSREAAKRSTPSLEALVRQAIVDDTAAILDSHLLDATAGDAVRPAGLLNGVSAVANGYGGGDYQAVIEDINALMTPFDTANASDSITLIMHPRQARKLAMTPGPDGTFGWSDRFMSEFNIVRSTHATAGRLIAVRTADFITATGDAPQFEMSNQATIHMEDAAPLEIVSGTGPTTADPVRSFFQTDTMGIRMVMDVSWKMRRTGVVQWINGTSW